MEYWGLELFNLLNIIIICLKRLSTENCYSNKNEKFVELLKSV